MITSMVSILLVVIGLVGLLGATWLWPVIGSAIFRYRFTNRFSGVRRGKLARSSEYRTISILIPAHNEESRISATLSSIINAVDYAKCLTPLFEISIIVGSDGSSDGTDSIALSSGVKVVRSVFCRGKWQTLKSLVETAPESDWYLIVDCGTLWEKNFLADIIARTGDHRVMAIAPTYRDPSGGAVVQALWAIEQHFKKIESGAGGPVTSHGATICYAGRELRRAFRSLGDGPWVNDDVVLPLTLRSLYPLKRIVYLPDLAASEATDFREPNTFAARRRIVEGNVQWIRELLPQVWSRNGVAGILALRRVFRLLWAYWILFIAVGLGMLLSIVPGGFLYLGILPVLFFVLLIIKGGKSLINAWVCSLLAPYYLMERKGIEGVVWR